MARRSFDLHQELADDLADHWGYRRLTTYGGVIDRPRVGTSPDPASGWPSSKVRLSGRLGSTESTAQVDPAAFTTGMMRAAQERGATLRLGRVTGLARKGERVVGVNLDGETLEGDVVVIAMGPWSLLAAQWLPLPPVFGLKGHSIVFDTGGAIPPEALFLEAEEPAGSTLSPEVFPRANGTTLPGLDPARLRRP